MTTPKYNLSFPEISDIEPIEIGPWNPFETTYNLHYPSDVGKQILILDFELDNYCI